VQAEVGCLGSFFVPACPEYAAHQTAATAVCSISAASDAGRVMSAAIESWNALAMSFKLTERVVPPAVILSACDRPLTEPMAAAGIERFFARASTAVGFSVETIIRAWVSPNNRA